jgi:RNA polymerase sigma-70 factor (ECF subfamily)
MPAAEERAVLDRLRAGDEEAFEMLVATYDGAMRRVAASFVRTAAATDEVVQETWLALVHGLDRFEERSSLQTWLFRILVNRARTAGVREARSLPLSSLDDNHADPRAFEPGFGSDGKWVSAPPRLDGDPEGRLLSGELRRHLLDAVDALAPSQRLVIMLRDVVGMPAEEVCEMLEITDANQRVLLHRARVSVRAALVPLVEVRT